MSIIILFKIKIIIKFKITKKLLKYQEFNF
jgi:hypothetical protein